MISLIVAIIATALVRSVFTLAALSPRIGDIATRRQHGAQMRTLLAADATGAALMGWLGGTADFPYGIPADVIAVFIGGRISFG